jgi:hypothetical protein
MFEGEKTSENSFLSMLPDIRNNISFWKVPTLCPFVLLIRAVFRCRQIWRIGGMILTGENRSTVIKSCEI